MLVCKFVELFDVTLMQVLLACLAIFLPNYQWISVEMLVTQCFSPFASGIWETWLEIKLTARYHGDNPLGTPIWMQHAKHMKFSWPLSNSLWKQDWVRSYVRSINSLIPVEIQLITITKISHFNSLWKGSWGDFRKSIYWFGQNFLLHETGFVLKNKCLNNMFVA